MIKSGFGTTLMCRLRSNAPTILVFSFLACFFISTAYAKEERKIANVVQRGNFAYVYDEKGIQFLTLGIGDGVAGFTSSTVSIKRGNFIHVFNQKGIQISVIPAGQ